MDLGFGGKRAVVTGGTGALGTAVVGRLLEVGAEVWIPVFDSKELIACPFRDHSSAQTVEGVDLTAPAAV
ncbi:MAG: short-chain dehydrogenase, partial [Pseudomonadota bacterium]|nr:short-chain dehydrogenase [Pseudomonadota bacterium]